MVSISGSILLDAVTTGLPELPSFQLYIQQLFYVATWNISGCVVVVGEPCASQGAKVPSRVISTYFICSGLGYAKSDHPKANQCKGVKKRHDAGVQRARRFLINLSFPLVFHTEPLSSSQNPFILPEAE